MKIIVIMDRLTDVVVKTLRDSYGSIEIVYSFHTLDEAVSSLSKKPVDVNKIVFSDKAVINKINISSEEKSYLTMQTLAKFKTLFTGETSDFFRCNSLIFLDSSEDDIISSYVDFIIKDLKMDYTKFQYNNATDISKYILGNLDLNTNKEKQYKTIVRTKRVGNKVLDYKIDEEEDGRHIIKIVDKNPLEEDFNRYEQRKNELSNSARELKIPIGQDAILKDIDIDEVVFKDIEEYVPEKVKTDYTPKVFVVTGKEKTGTSVTCFSLAKSAYSAGKKVLLIDACRNLGLSYTCEFAVNQPLLLVPLHSIVKDIVPTVSHMRESDKISVLVNTLDFARRLDYTGMMVINMYAILLEHLNYYDIIIIDVNEEGLKTLKPMLDGFGAEYIVTFSRNLPSLVETGDYVKRYLYNHKSLLLIPVDNFNMLRGFPVVNNSTLKAYITKLYPKDCNVTATLKIRDIEKIDGVLYHVVDGFLEEKGVKANV